MLVRYFRRPSRIEQLRSSTGGYLLEGFAKELSESRYQWVAARKHIRAAEHFLHWIAHRKLSIASVEERCAQQFLDHLKRCCCRGHHPPLKPHRQKFSVDLWLAYLRRGGIVTTPSPAEPATETPLLATFCDWMRQQRGVSDTTLSIYHFELRAFLKKLGEDPSRYDARNLRQFVLDKSQHSGWASARKCICAIHMFLRFLISQGSCPDYLYASIPTFVHWRLSALPRYLQADQVEQVIASPDLATSLGRRNRAILLLLARLGLRASDIVQLQLDDLDWREGMIRVSGKGRRQTVLPLTQEVGDALAAYIKDHRPQADTDAVFVRSSAPYLAFADSNAISILVARAMRRTRINCPKRGAAHILRHSVASAMLRQGVSLQEIAGVLGEAEQAAVEDGAAAYENLLSKLSDVPTPAGPTPRQLGAGLVQITSVRPALPASTLRTREVTALEVESQINSRNSRRISTAAYNSRIAVTGFRRIARCAGT